jgi:hypothetical protein
MSKARILAEMRELFGEILVKRAQQADPADLDLSADLMDRVHGSANELLANRGNPAEQQQYVGGLTYEVRLVLCMWLMDTNLAARLVRAAYAVGTQVCR